MALCCIWEKVIVGPYKDPVSLQVLEVGCTSGVHHLLHMDTVGRRAMACATLSCWPHLPMACENGHHVLARLPPRRRCLPPPQALQLRRPPLHPTLLQLLPPPPSFCPPPPFLQTCPRDWEERERSAYKLYKMINALKLTSGLCFSITASPIQHQSFLPGIVFGFQKRTRNNLITCTQAGQDVDSQIRLGLDEWIKKNDEIVRVAPALLGGSSFLLVLVNRTLSGIAPVVDASSAQSRADVIALVLAATVVLTGLVWISVKPRKLIPVELSGISCLRLEESLPASAAAEVTWAWETLKNVSCCQGLVIVYQGRCVLQAGLASEVQGEAKGVDSLNLVKGSLCQAAWRSGKQSYLANLSLYPGRFELSFLPSNTQAVILQPLGDEGIMIVAGDTVRGFGPTDQAWILSVGEKLDATLGRSTSTTG